MMFSRALGIRWLIDSESFILLSFAVFVSRAVRSHFRSAESWQLLPVKSDHFEGGCAGILCVIGLNVAVSVRLMRCYVSEVFWKGNDGIEIRWCLFSGLSVDGCVFFRCFKTKWCRYLWMVRGLRIQSSLAECGSYLWCIGFLSLFWWEHFFYWGSKCLLIMCSAQKLT
jgi:hypothetical protein